jgi:hypothetical protein
MKQFNVLDLASRNQLQRVPALPFQGRPVAWRAQC